MSSSFISSSLHLFISLCLSSQAGALPLLLDDDAEDAPSPSWMELKLNNNNNSSSSSNNNNNNNNNNSDGKDWSSAFASSLAADARAAVDMINALSCVPMSPPSTRGIKDAQLAAGATTNSDSSSSNNNNNNNRVPPGIAANPFPLVVDRLRAVHADGG